MLNNVRPVHLDGLLCIEESFLTYAAYEKKDFVLLFGHMLGFEFFPNEPEYNGLLGKRICYGIKDIYEFFQLMNKYCGIKATWHSKLPSSPEEYVRLIKKRLDEDKPTITYTNMYWCPWLENYRKTMHDHYFLITGYDENGFICIDPMFSEESCKLPYENFTKVYYPENGMLDNPPVGYYIELDKIKSDENDYSIITYEIAKKLKDDESVNKIKEFATKIMEEFDFENEFKEFNKNVFDVYIHRNIGLIARGRLLFVEFIKHVFTEIDSPNKQEIINNIETASSRWQSMRGLLTKYFFTEFNERGRNKLNTMLNDVAIIEENAINLFYDIAVNRVMNKCVN